MTCIGPEAGNCYAHVTNPTTHEFPMGKEKQQTDFFTSIQHLGITKAGLKVLIRIPLFNLGLQSDFLHCDNM
jgi:hypothetical protein